MNYKHYVIIRFYCNDMLDKNILFSNDLLMPAINIFKNYTLKSLENQTNTNFEIILAIHNDIDIKNEAIISLYNIDSSIKINIMKLRDIQQFIINNTKNCEYLITTRLDHDDLIQNNANEAVIQSLYNNANIPVFTHAFTSGGTIINNDFNNVYEFNPTYNGKGCIGLFYSLIIKKDIISKLKIQNILELGNHTLIYDKLKELCINANILYKNIENSEYCSWLYVKHDFNHSTYINENLNKNWHRSNNKINNSLEYFYERFGKINI
ncbi:MAG: hypothetical protein [Wendovervirus sonii]|uniref:Glycosyltransferase n=1 Tax=phage Lak_Megaphage_Sonny TaxID=3109229 RepID=A0ABZ0Z270_9CAUD|nr:MAG: hypothetical protein [phage Lak_Megaphage_Sonny]